LISLPPGGTQVARKSQLDLNLLRLFLVRFDLEELRLIASVAGIVFCARAEPERLVIVAGANAGVARNTVVRSGIRNLLGMTFLPGSGPVWAESRIMAPNPQVV
jgi:hypothetical protein